MLSFDGVAAVGVASGREVVGVSRQPPMRSVRMSSGVFGRDVRGLGATRVSSAGACGSTCPGLAGSSSVQRGLFLWGECLVGVLAFGVLAFGVLLFGFLAFEVLGFEVLPFFASDWEVAFVRAGAGEQVRSGRVCQSPGFVVSVEASVSGGLVDFVEPVEPVELVEPVVSVESVVVAVSFVSVSLVGFAGSAGFDEQSSWSGVGAFGLSSGPGGVWVSFELWGHAQSFDVSASGAPASNPPASAFVGV
ncbi:hypothetical protein OG948_02865 [Embleya sp. NBC_00888]|uniref:hypothetical protein n=1 Tax=Embleya sp. NBC_00888 TaxID=2975960 RepID=UPI00386861BB|nr:hypothetical protein OG948_02865 [Embleya sp. NBC_00888]